MKGVATVFPSKSDSLRIASRSPLASVVHTSLKNIPAGSTILVAASGGADSTGLALLAAAVARRGDWVVCLATVDHGLRVESAQDAECVVALGAWLGVAVERCDLHVAPGPSVAARARNARHAALARMATNVGAAAVLMAHHAEDQLETVLMRLIRGAGAKASAGMPKARSLHGTIRLIRPLLERSVSEIRALLLQTGVPWREDPSNQDRSKPRGRLRHEVLPVLESIRAGAAVRAARSARRLQGAARALSREARGLLCGDGPWPRARLRKANSEALALALRKRFTDATESMLERAVQTIRSSGAQTKRFRFPHAHLHVLAKTVSLVRETAGIR